MVTACVRALRSAWRIETSLARATGIAAKTIQPLHLLRIQRWEGIALCGEKRGGPQKRMLRTVRS